MTIRSLVSSYLSGEHIG